VVKRPDAVKVAVIGVGYLGTFHAQKYAASEASELVAVVDVDQAKGQKLAKKLNCESFTDYRQVVSLGVKCVSVVSDTLTHFEIAKFFLENGIDVLLEKPMANTILEAKELIDIATRNGRILQVGHLERFNPAFKAMKELLTSPRFFEARRIAKFSGRGFDVDVVSDLMIHDIDIICHLVGKPLLRVEAVGIPVLTNTVDIANARLTFQDGAVANVTASRAAYASERTLRIFQSDVYISVNFEHKKLKVYTRDPNSDSRGLKSISRIEKDLAIGDALADEIASFLNCVLERKAPIVGGEDGLRALEVADRIRAAFRESLALIPSHAEDHSKIANF